jgi:hypothetical protein
VRTSASAERRPLDERARRDRIAGVAAPARDRHARQTQHLREGEQLGIAAIAAVGSASAATALRGRSESSTGIAPSERWSAPGMTTAANGRSIVRASGVTTTSGTVVPSSPTSSSAAAAIGGR